MYCPNCGAPTSSNQRYCRLCGAGLTVDGSTPFNLRAWALLALTLMFAGLLIAMGGKIWAVKWVIFTGLLVMFAGIFGIAAFSILRQTRPRRSLPASPSAKEVETLRADTTNKLPPLDPDSFIPSVVDDTTELLKTPSRDRTT